MRRPIEIAGRIEQRRNLRSSLEIRAPRCSLTDAAPATLRRIARDQLPLDRTLEHGGSARSGVAALIASHVANSGQVVAIAPGEGPDAGHWVIVTEEHTTGTGRYAGPPPRSTRHASPGQPPRRRMGRQRLEPRKLTTTTVIALDASRAISCTREDFATHQRSL
jgi:hypothetical protein